MFSRTSALIIILLLIVIICTLICCTVSYFVYKSSPIELYKAFEGKPYLWIYWEGPKPDYITLCIESIFKHCKNSFNVILLNNNTINNFLPEIQEKNVYLQKLEIPQKVDYYRVALLYKYGGLYLDSDVLVLRDPFEVVAKLKNYDFVGFGCTGGPCDDGYGRPSNWILASRKKGILITKVLNNLESKLIKNKHWEYHDLGKLIFWEELEKLKNTDYKYYHAMHVDSSRDSRGLWVNSERLFSNEPIEYKNEKNMIFVIIYNSQMDKLRDLSRSYLLSSDLNISKFFRKALL